MESPEQSHTRPSIQLTVSGPNDNADVASPIVLCDSPPESNSLNNSRRRHSKKKGRTLDSPRAQSPRNQSPRTQTRDSREDPPPPSSPRKPPAEVKPARGNSIEPTERTSRHRDRAGYTSDPGTREKEKDTVKIREKGKTSKEKEEKKEKKRRHRRERDGPPSIPHHLHHVSAEIKPTLICIINPKSGSQRGAELVPLVEKILGPSCVWDLSKGSPVSFLGSFKNTPALRVIACGGDGTIRWVIQSILDCKMRPTPLLGILPLGTGNDLSRAFGWGMAYTPKERDIKMLLDKMRVAYARPLDVWKVRAKNGSERSSEIMFNYFNMGWDAQAAYSFHTLRLESPELFKARFLNKCVYAYYGLETMFRGILDLPSLIEVRIDDQPITLPPELKTLILLNFTNYQNGVDVWGPPTATDSRQPRMDDGLLEVVGLGGLHHEALSRLEITRGIRLGQGSKVSIINKYTDGPFPVAYDGEPTMQQWESISVRCWGQVHILSNPDLDKPERSSGFFFLLP